MINLIQANATLVHNTPHVTASPDPDDNQILAIAEAASADYLVTGDYGHLVALGRHSGTRILNPRAFVDRVLGD